MGKSWRYWIFLSTNYSTFRYLLINFVITLPQKLAKYSVSWQMSSNFYLFLVRIQVLSFLLQNDTLTNTKICSPINCIRRSAKSIICQTAFIQTTNDNIQTLKICISSVKNATNFSNHRRETNIHICHDDQSKSIERFVVPYIIAVHWRGD